MLKLAIAIFNY